MNFSKLYNQEIWSFKFLDAFLFQLAPNMLTDPDKPTKRRLKHRMCQTRRIAASPRRRITEEVVGILIHLNPLE